MKTCPRCRETLPLDTGFHVARRRKDGRQPWCKRCQRAAVRSGPKSAPASAWLQQQVRGALPARP